MSWWPRLQSRPFYPANVARTRGSRRGVSQREAVNPYATPLDYEWPHDATKYLMRCRVIAPIEVLLILWKAHGRTEAEATFRAWVSQPWVVLDRDMSSSHSPAQCRYHFRPLDVIKGFDLCMDSIAFDRALQ